MKPLFPLIVLALPLLSQTNGHIETAPITTHLTATATEPPPPPNYILGPGDLITLFTPDLEEISNKPLRINMRGDLNIPLAGHIHAGGLTTDQLESEIESHLKKYVHSPDVLVNVSEFHSQPVSILGAVSNPGVHQLEGHKNLFEVISAAGGLRPDSGNTVTVTRESKWGPIPLPNAHLDPTGQFSVASVSAKSITDGSNPAQNIVIKPNDVISVSKADVVYCIGSVHKPGGYVVGQQETLTALQVISLAEGLDNKAAPSKARIMRVTVGSATRTEIPIDIKKLMAGKTPDMVLNPEDILFVPESTVKALGSKAGQAALTIGTGVAIYAHP